ncbi:MAG TPA: glycerophosphodiester phosphodiesterase family protein, partial [bacterium]|nr:glycerophosphodiester phosphodiesterase family protein [bacterium]
MKRIAIWMGILMMLATHARAADTKPLIIAHRGYSRVAPENTLAAARRALALKPQPAYIEIDLHRSLDGVLVVSHDDNTLRTTGVPGLIREQTFDQLRALGAGYAKVFGDAFKGVKIMSFEDILNAVKDTPVGIMIECKQLLLEDQVIEILRNRNELGKHVLASFDELTIYRAKQIEPSLRT